MPELDAERVDGPAASELRSPAIRAALRNTDLRRAMIAYFASCNTEWGLWPALLVYAYATSGRTVAGFVAIGLFVPGALIAPFAGSAADGPRPNRVLLVVYCVQALALGVAALMAYLDGPLLTVIVPAGVALTAIAYVRPCFAVVEPGLVASARELTAANLLAGYGESASVLIGPALAGVLIAVDGPPLMLATCCGLALVGVAATLPLIRLDLGVSAATPQRTISRTGALVRGVRLLCERKGAFELLIVLGSQYLFIGALDLILVVLSAEKFGLGSSGPALLTAAFGAGAVLGAGASTALVARRRLAPLLIISVLVICGSLALVAGVPELAVALVALPIAGLSRAVLDVAGRMLMQRAAPQDALALIFATMESSALLACAVGTIIAQVVIASFGVRVAMLTIGALLALVLLTSARQLIHVDASADAPVVTIRLLRRIPVFAPLPGPALEGVARAARQVSAAAGTTIIREGDRGDNYFAVVSGQVDVRKAGRHVRAMTRGEGFGEIALLADVPRTATVVADTDVELLEVARPAFLTAVTGHDASRQAAWSVARTLHPTLGAAESGSPGSDS